MFDATKRSDLIDDGYITHLNGYALLILGTTKTLLQYINGGCAGYCISTTNDRLNYCIMADWILVGVIMG